jgi:hypothetical protein
MMIFDQGAKVCFNVDGLLRGDKAAQAAWYAAGRQWGWFNVDDIRADMGEPPLPDGKGEVYLQPVNMAEIGSDVPEAGFTPTAGYVAGPASTAPNPAEAPPKTDQVYATSTRRK